MQHINVEFKALHILSIISEILNFNTLKNEYSYYHLNFREKND